MFDVPKIQRALDLREYADELEEELAVWVNPPRALIQELFSAHADLSSILQRIQDNDDVDGVDAEIESLNEKIISIYARLWNQEPDDVREFALDIQDTDPALWSYMTSKTRGLIADHRSGVKKK